MKLNSLFDGVTDNQQLIDRLKKRWGANPDMEAIFKALDPKKHDVMDQKLRPDRYVFKMDNSAPNNMVPVPFNPGIGIPAGQTLPKNTLPGIGNNQIGNAGANKPIFSHIERVNRIALGLQKLIIARAVSFSVGNPIIRTFTGDVTEDYKIAIKGLERVLKDNHEVALNKRVAKSIYSATEVAEYWFTTEQPEAFDKYGFSTKQKIKCVVFSPLDGMTLYPYMDLYGNLIALSREFSFTDPVSNEVTKFFETFLDEEKVLFTAKAGGEWERVDQELPYGKNPVVYGRQPVPDFEDVNIIIERLELLLSNFGEVNDYNMGPKHFVKGNILSWGQKGQANTLIQGDKDSEYDVVSWDHAPESIKNEIEILLKFIFSLSQTPDISFDNLKSLGNISGVALKLLFTDQHLKVMDKADILVEYFERRDSVILSMLKYLNSAKKEVYDLPDIDHDLDPFMIADEKEQVEIALLKNGDQPIASQETTVREFGGDDSELQRIKAEETERNTARVTEPTI